MTIRVAAIEVSHWHSIYDAAYLLHLTRMSDVQVVGVQDPNRQVATKRAAAVGHPPVFTDYKQMLAETRPDFVLALGRHSIMAEIAQYLLDKGYPFLMEKPMGFNAEQVHRIAEKAKALKGFAAVSLSQRYLPFTKQAKKMIAEGSFGEISHMYFRLNRPTSDRYIAYDSPWMLDPSISSGGCLRNLGVHGLDLFLFLTGEEAEVTGAQLSWKMYGRRVEDYASVLLRSKSGILCTLEVGNTYPRDGTDGEWKIAGRDVMLIARDRDKIMHIVTSEGEETMSAQPEEAPYYMVLRDVLNRWQRREPPPISVHDCYRAVQLIDQAYQMAGNPYT